MHKNFLIFILKIMLLGSFFGPSSFASNTDLQKQMKQMQEQSEDLLKQFQNFQNANKKPSQKGEKKAKANSKDMSKHINKMLERYRSMDLSEIEAELYKTSQGSKLGVIFDKFPKSLEFMARIYQDQVAIPRMIKMAEDYEKLKHASLYMLGTVLLSYILGKILIRHNMGLGRRFMMRIVRSLCIWSLRFGILGYFYGFYLSPLGRIIKTVFIDGLFINKT